MPHSVFTGRPTPAPGEPFFLPEDTAAALALAEEERDTCPSCGMPKAWCRDPEAQYKGFEAHDEQCHATYALASHRGVESPDRDATQTSVRFRKGYRVEFDAGLDLPASGNEGE